MLCCRVFDLLRIVDLSVCQNKDSVLLAAHLHVLGLLERCDDVCAIVICGEMLQLGKRTLLCVFTVLDDGIGLTLVIHVAETTSETFDRERTPDWQAANKKFERVDSGLHTPL